MYPSLLTRARWYLRILALGLRERVFGIECACGARTPLPVPPGWHYGTGPTDDARWVCPDCRAQGAEGTQW